MTRGLHPPGTLSNNDIATLQQLRRDIYGNAIKGGFFGMGSGLILHTAGQWARKLGITKAKFNRNTMMLSVLGGGAFGMFLFATSTGKEQVYKLHPIFQVGAIPKGDLDYSKKVQKAQLLSSENGENANEQEENEEEHNVDISKLQTMRAVRRKTMQDNLEHGKGFSDSHGGHWYHDDVNNDNVDMEKIKEHRAIRRKTLNNTIQNQHGLSDSHGGRWSS
eukprot:CAMPEP_0113613462 /NCGR_PEP_ID=MMETSP0017_2-20120614/6650_1 /TAXON_ID=2856 /ORGANISM="Cylindrotheca closterium" /LENGTH=219 /DNA_ID=CAMNT_0000522573 /DNA_START=90 /DNA_END=752 /DNA_ORIENTATION=+ /assembly_acc=CAM_ASM_000147